MTSGKHNLYTDDDTDYMLQYYVNEEKIDVQMREKIDEEMTKKVQGTQFRLDSRIPNTEKKITTEEQTELPTNSSQKSPIRNQVNRASGSNYMQSPRNFFSSPSEKFTRSPYGQKISPHINNIPISRQPFERNYNDRHNGYNNLSEKSDCFNLSDRSYRSYRSDRSERENRSMKPILTPRLSANTGNRGISNQMLADKLIADVEKYNETPEERRARARDAYNQLQRLVDKYDIKLNRQYTIDDDPEEMEEEFKMHKENRNRDNQVKFYKNVLLNICCGAEFLNDKYNPFEFKLKDWSKQVASDMDDYTEVLEELYEKYKSSGGRFPPEVRLLFMIIMSGVTFHISQSLFGAEGLGKTIQQNPSVLNKLLGGLMGNGKGGGIASMLGGLGKDDDEPKADTSIAPNHKNLLSAIRRQQSRNKPVDPTSEKPKSEESEQSVGDTTSAQASTSIGIDTSNMITKREMEAREALAAERERRLLAEQRMALENQMRRQNELHAAQLNSLRDRFEQFSARPNYSSQNINGSERSDRSERSERRRHNQVLSDASRKPRFHTTLMQHQYRPQSYQSEKESMFESERYNNQRIPSHAPPQQMQNMHSMRSEQLGQNAISNNNFSELFSSDKKMESENSTVTNKSNYLDDIIDSLNDDSDDIDLDDIEFSPKPTPKPPVSVRKPRNSATKSSTRSEGSASKRGNVIKL